MEPLEQELTCENAVKNFNLPLIFNSAASSSSPMPFFATQTYRPESVGFVRSIVKTLRPNDDSIRDRSIEKLAPSPSFLHVMIGVGFPLAMHVNIALFVPIISRFLGDTETLAGTT